MNNKYQPFILKPCDNCPFRKDCVDGWLTEGRAKEIINSIAVKKEAFVCHKTYSNKNSKKVITQKSKGCAGAAMLLLKNNTLNTPLQIAIKLNLTAPEQFSGTNMVFDTYEEFISRHS